MSDLDDIVSEFLVESYENLDQLDRDLVELEEHPDSVDVLASIFRTMHTIKGTCGFLGFGILESVAHAAENLLSLLRDGKLLMNPEIATSLLSTVDAVRSMLRAIEETGSDEGDDFAALVAELVRLQAGGDDPAKAPDTGRAAAMAQHPSAGSAPAPVPAPAPAPPPALEASVFEVQSETAPPPPRPLLGELLLHDGAVTPEEVALAMSEQVLGDERPIGEILVAHGAVPAEEVQQALRAQVDHRSAVADSSIRVDVDLLDTLMNLVGELVLARNQILLLTAGEQDTKFAAPAQRLNLITTELQEGVMKTRMQPIGNVWGKFPRVVRDLALACGKSVRLELDGADTELDKTIIEAIKDPLTHLVRNAVDHGIEASETRQAAGKPAEGRLLLRAFHEGGKVNIEIIDDGAGIDADKLKARALERGLIAPDVANRMAQRELLNLIFLPGFSTAAKVSNVSGRGVGMDVVKTNIERIGGSVDISTELGRGSTFKISIPLTLAIIPALVVTSGDERYAIPQISLLELVRLEGEQARAGIELIHGAPVYRLRGRLLPIVDLADELSGGTGMVQRERDVVSIVVLQADDRQFGLVVDQINDTQEIVVKPLGKLVKGVTTFAGATNMGDGRVALILDVLGVAHRAGVVSEARDRILAEAEAAMATSAARSQTLLLLGVGDDRRVAIPLSAVSRLEEFQVDAVETAGHRSVVQYRGEILPLVDLASALGYGSDTTTGAGDTLNVVVYTHQERRVGIVVGRVVDIVDQEIDEGTSSVVIHGRVTELIDIATVVAGDSYPSFSAAGAF